MEFRRDQSESKSEQGSLTRNLRYEQDEHIWAVQHRSVGNGGGHKEQIQVRYSNRAKLVIKCNCCNKCYHQIKENECSIVRLAALAFTEVGLCRIEQVTLFLN